MQTTIMIQNEAELDKVIDEFGGKQVQINALVAEQKIRKQLIEAFANANGIKKRLTENYRLVMKPGKEQLRKEAGKEDRDIVALLEADETAREFVIATYDGEAIKAYVRGLDEAEDWLAQHGLVLTEPQRHAQIEELA